MVIVGLKTRKMESFLFLVVLLSGCFALEGKTIIFPRETATDNVILKHTVSKPLTQLTVCLRSFTELTRNYALFSLATPGTGKDNTFLIFPTSPNTVSIYVNQEEFIFKVDPAALDWRHTCVAWDYETGLLQLNIDGKSYPRKVTKKGSPIGTEMSVILGQEQDTFGGGFETAQSFIGEIREVHVWDWVLPPDAMKSFSHGYWFPHGNIFSWKDGTYEIKGGAVAVEY
ncbi:C-reactive protein-like isoform X2 [Engystomops pustulosus]|uniref:C-reactive protein-like isoform X2 n=1 Tax=Engystomops pustulosus TaxID=76066 RepID=UPI003AFA4D8A